jgi:hypothetical protein
LNIEAEVEINRRPARLGQDLDLLHVWLDDPQRIDKIRIRPFLQEMSKSLPVAIRIGGDLGGDPH